jgi:cytochrome c oxidase subunit 2
VATIPVGADRRRRPLLAHLGVASLAALAVACGSDDATDPGLDTGSGDSPVARGRDVAEDWGCVSCHSNDGSAGDGPTWQGIWGTTVQLDDGRTAVVDAAYVERSIRDPDADVVDGVDPVMPAFNLDDGDVDAIVAYIESLGASG